VKPFSKKAVAIAVIFGIISVIILAYLKAQGIFLIIMLWILVPVFIKKIADRIKDFRK